MTNPFYDPYQVLSKVYAEGAHLKIALAETPIEEAHRSRTVKVCYGVLEHDAYLSLCIRSVADKSPKQSVRILFKIAIYFLIFLEKPRYMVTDLAVSKAAWRALSMPRFVGLIGKKLQFHRGMRDFRL